MAWLLKSDKKHMHKHAEMNEEKNGWQCKKTKKPINTVRTGRSIHVAGFSGGFGEVRQVDHLWCTGCDTQPEIRYGEPIQENELVEI
ncbi:MAG: hypothetical protein AAB590_03770 [Patescibacteria group bacterium]